MRVAPWALCALLFVFVAPARSAPPAPLAVSLPDTGTYSLWVQSRTGVISVLPITVTHKQIVALPAGRGGGTLYVLDAHTGQVAARSVAGSGPVTLAVSDFRPVAALAPPTVPQAAAPVSNPGPAAPGRRAEGNREGGVGQFVSWLLGLALAAGVVWFLVRVVQTRGEPLIILARRAGIAVPDPKALDPNAGTMPVYQPPKPRVVETIPSDAGLPPKAAPLTTTPGGTAAVSPPMAPLSMGTAGANGAFAPQLIGLEGLAAGSTFALADGEVTLGRDGSNDIVLAENSVSRRHALLTRDANGGVHLADAGSANGVFVNGRRVQEVVLAPGDEIRIGDNSFRFDNSMA